MARAKHTLDDVEVIDVSKVSESDKAEAKRAGARALAKVGDIQGQLDAIVPILEAPEGQERKTVENEFQKLSLPAVRELRYQLLHSPDARVRREVANSVLDRAGHGKREPGALGNGSVIVVTGFVQGQPLWKQEKVIDAKVTQDGPGPVPGTAERREEDGAVRDTGVPEVADGRGPAPNPE